MMSSCWHFMSSCRHHALVLAFQFFNFLSVPKRSKHGFWLGFGFGWGTGFLVVFLVFVLGYLGHLFGHRNDWIFLGFLSLFLFLFWGTCRFTQAMECILGQGMDGTVELKINLD